MTDHDVIEGTRTRTTAQDATPHDDETAAFVDFLTAEFPDWQFEVDATATWDGSSRTRWVARRDGHHPQSELTAGKLHRRLSDYEERLSARRPGDN